MQDITEIEKDILIKANNNLDFKTGLDAANELRTKWGDIAISVAGKLQKQGYLQDCKYYMGGGIALGYLTAAGRAYLAELNGDKLGQSSLVINNTFGDNTEIHALQQGQNNLINKNAEVDYSKLLDMILNIQKLEPLYSKETAYNSEVSNVLEELKDSAKKQSPSGKINKLWNKFLSLLNSNAFGNITNIVATIMSAYGIFN